MVDRALSVKATINSLSPSEFALFRENTFNREEFTSLLFKCFVYETTINKDNTLNKCHKKLTNIINSRKNTKNNKKLNERKQIGLSLNDMSEPLIGNISSYLDKSSVFKFQIINPHIYISCNKFKSSLSNFIISIKSVEAIRTLETLNVFQLNRFKMVKYLTIDMHSVPIPICFDLLKSILSLRFNNLTKLSIFAATSRFSEILKKLHAFNFPVFNNIQNIEWSLKNSADDETAQQIIDLTPNVQFMSINNRSGVGFDEIYQLQYDTKLILNRLSNLRGCNFNGLGENMEKTIYINFLSQIESLHILIRNKFSRMEIQNEQIDVRNLKELCMPIDEMPVSIRNCNKLKRIFIKSVQNAADLENILSVILTDKYMLEEIYINAYQVWYDHDYVQLDNLIDVISDCLNSCNVKKETLKVYVESHPKFVKVSVDAIKKLIESMNKITTHDFMFIYNELDGNNAEFLKIQKELNHLNNNYIVKFDEVMAINGDRMSRKIIISNRKNRMCGYGGRWMMTCNCCKHL